MRIHGCLLVHLFKLLLERSLERVQTKARNFVALINDHRRAGDGCILAPGRWVLIEMIDLEVYLVLPRRTGRESSYQLLIAASAGARAKKFD